MSTGDETRREDESQPEFESDTDPGYQGEERRDHPRVSFQALVEVIPPDGELHKCEGVNVSLGGALLRKTNTGHLPELGETVVIETTSERLAFEGVVVRREPGERCFAVKWVELGYYQTEYLAKTVGSEEADPASADPKAEG
jgi:hypothetical protein